MSDATRTLLVCQEGKTPFRITIPAEHKVTCGAQPGTHGRKDLRIYEGAGKEHQVACFEEVVSFRDVSLPVEFVSKDEILELDVLWRADKETKGIPKRLMPIEFNDDVTREAFGR